MRDGFVFYASWLEAIKNLPREMQGEVLTAIIEYGLYGETTEAPKPITSAMLAMVKPQIDVNNKRYENGKKGGRPPKSETKEKPNRNQRETKEKPNETKSEPKEKDKYKDKETTTIVVGKKDAAEAATLSRKEGFYKSLIPFLEKYPKEMIRQFFEYWSEMNKSRTKMRWEQEKTWEADKRLRTWASREKNYENKSNYTSKQDANDYAMRQYLADREKLEQGIHDEVPKPF